MGRAGSAVEAPERRGAAPPGYECLDGDVPVVHAPRLAEKAGEVQGYLAQGYRTLAEVLSVEPPEIAALLVADEDWDEAPRDNARPYPPGLPYFTRSVEPPALVLPEELSPVFRPCTEVTQPLTVWHEMAHAFLLRREVVRTPAWLREFVPQAAAAAVASKVGLSLDEHVSRIDRDPGFTVRDVRGPAGADDQMSFQNLLLLLGTAALDEFGDGFLTKLVHALWEENEIVDEVRAEELFADALGPGGREWLMSRPEF
ncbi:MAG TPA: hypothetical protein VHM69_14395 [Rubrobacter sp.]|nr:hypothetical protein [Rubrobacter sp.]